MDEKSVRFGLIGAAADVLKPPGEREGAAIGLGGPAPVFIATNFLLKVAHRSRLLNISHELTGLKNRASNGKKEAAES